MSGVPPPLLLLLCGIVISLGLTVSTFMQAPYNEVVAIMREERVKTLLGVRFLIIFTVWWVAAGLTIGGAYIITGVWLI